MVKTPTRAIFHILLLSFVCVGLSACIHPEAPTDVPALAIRGNYNTQVTLTDDNSCGNVSVQSLPTIIQQEPGAAEFVFSHAGNDYGATLDADGSFVTEHKRLVASGMVYTVTFTGTFSTTGFSSLGTVEIQQTQEPRQCYYVVRLEGTKAPASP